MKSMWKVVSGAVALAIGLLLAGPAMAEINYNYMEVDYVNVDVDFSEDVVDEGVSARVENDSDAGFSIGGSWQFYENWHMFGEYSNASNDINISGTVDDMDISVSGDFDITRWRVGVGYGHPVNSDVSVYGRISYDSIEFDDFSVADIEDIGKTDDSGIGAESGFRWMAAEPFELQGYVRYTAVGEVDVNVDNEFDNDFLVGVAGRYYFNDVIGVQAGYEVGEIDTWNLSARMRF